MIGNSGETTRPIVVPMEVETMDIEVIMEGLVTTVEEPETTQDLAMVEEIKEAFSRTPSSFKITRDSTM